MSESDILSFSWTGAGPAYIDQPTTRRLGDIVIGCYGGASLGGGFKNEDAVWLLSDPAGDWRFCALIDGHYSTESDDLIIEALEAHRSRLIEAMGLTPGAAFEQVRSLLIEGFSSAEFREACRHVIGEASAIFCAQKGRFVFCFSVGDCLAFALHPELGGLGQFAMNQRHFYEWLGRSNIFDLESPAFTTGTQELRSGSNVVVMATDGLYEYPGSPFENPVGIYNAMGPQQPDLEGGVLAALQKVHHDRGRDSATVIAWRVQVREQATRSSPMPR